MASSGRSSFCCGSRILEHDEWEPGSSSSSPNNPTFCVPNMPGIPSTLPKPAGLPPLPSILTLPQPNTVPPLPTNLPKPKALPPLSSMPSIPIVSQATLPPLPSTNSLPNIPPVPTTIPSIPFFFPPPSN